jgi:phage shock protein C
MTQEPTTGGPTRRLTRSRTDRVIAGVCGGIGHYFGVDPVLVRIAFVILTVLGGSGLLAYLVGWVLMPEAVEGAEPSDAPRREWGDQAPLVIGGALIAIGGVILVGQFIPVFWQVFWPMLLVAVGIAVIVGASRR